MKHMKKCITILFILGLILGGLFLQTDEVQATTEKQALLDKIEKESAENILKSYYDDFDGDGIKELFAITQKGQDEAHHIWYAGKTEVKEVKFDNYECYYDSSDKSIVKVSKNQKIFIMECGYDGRREFPVCCYVSSGKVQVINQQLEGLVQLSGKEFAFHPDELDYRSGDCPAGHTHKRYYLKWNGKEFIEYKGTAISEKKLGSYKNGRSVIDKIRKEGYKIEEIYERSNSIININVSKNEDEDIVVFENVTLELKDGKVKVVDNPYGPYKPTDGIVTRSSYGGVYLENSGSIE